jgi:hypothetical protein
MECAMEPQARPDSAQEISEDDGSAAEHEMTPDQRADFERTVVHEDTADDALEPTVPPPDHDRRPTT